MAGSKEKTVFTVKLDCEQSLFFFRISEGSARERERRAAKRVVI